jgi:DNA-binding transcriptional ArsR family regulator
LAQGVTNVDWESVAREALHPLRVRIIKRAAAEPDARFSPVGLAAEFGEPLGNISYHVRSLFAAGLLVKAGTATRRGAVQHYYKASMKLLR